MKPVYRNYGHYIQDGWSRTPKKYFIDIADLLEKAVVPQDCEVLDIGCATGNFLGYIHERFPKATLVGVDVFDELLETGRQLAPYAQFEKRRCLTSRVWLVADSMWSRHLGFCRCFRLIS